MMLRRYRAVIAAVVVVAVIAGLMFHRSSMLRSVKATESSTASAQSQLKQKLLEKKQLLEQTLNERKRAVEMGRDSYQSLMQAQVAVWRVDIELSDSKEERASIYDKIIQFYADCEKSVQLQVNAGQVPKSALREVTISRLDIEIEMLKDQLN